MKNPKRLIDILEETYQDLIEFSINHPWYFLTIYLLAMLMSLTGMNITGR